MGYSHCRQCILLERERKSCYTKAYCTGATRILLENTVETRTLSSDPACTHDNIIFSKLVSEFTSIVSFYRDVYVGFCMWTHVLHDPSGRKNGLLAPVHHHVHSLSHFLQAILYTHVYTIHSLFEHVQKFFKQLVRFFYNKRG